jgi:hypothetical protein
MGGSFHARDRRNRVRLGSVTSRLVVFVELGANAVAALDAQNVEIFPCP